MIHPIPSGTRDVLPDELRELRAITDAMLAVFEARGYGEVATPALEYEDVLRRGDPAAADPAYRLFDEHGNVLVLRSDMTIPIARLVATRYASVAGPLRFCYIQHAYRAVRQHRGQPREIRQAGIELIGAPGPEGTAEAVSMLCAALDAAGLVSYRVGLGDASLFPRALERARVAAGARPRILHELAARDLVGLERELSGVGAAELLDIARTRGGVEVLDGVPEASTLREVYALLAPDVASRVIFDLGLVRTLGYYTGAVFEVYDAAFGSPLGGGGRYDDLLGRFGHDAAGLRVGARRRTGARGAAGGRSRMTRPAGSHASAGTRPGARSRGRGPRSGDMRIAVPRGAMLKQTLDVLDGLGIDTAEVRSNDRKLLFEEAGIITMRPSDVPIYVEAGAADLGVTGKDVLAEHPERGVYELLDLGFGACTMVFATVAGEDPAAEALRRLGMMRIATKYPRIAA